MRSLRPFWYLPFFLAGLAAAAFAGVLEGAPGYMDADYYFAGGKQLAEGKGLWQPYIWNYLDDPRGIPQPSHTYWMPLSSLLAAAGYRMGNSFRAAQIPFWLLAALLPPATIFLGMRLHGKRGWALLGGVFALFPAFYLAYLPTTDAFPATMLLGGGMVLVASSGMKPVLRFLAAGLLAGLMHLARADGILWLFGLLGLAVYAGIKQHNLRVANERVAWGSRITPILACLAGYLAVMGFWYARNLQTWGSLFPPGGSHTLWLTRYEDMFVYPGSLLNLQSWLTSGIGAILRARWDALLANLQTLVAVQGSIALFPFILIGLWQLRRERVVLFAAGMWLAIFAAFTLVFPFAGINGSFFHSGAAVQLVFWAAAPLGVETVVGFISHWRKWEKGRQVQRFVEVLLVLIVFLLSGGLLYQHVAGSKETGAWSESGQHYRQVESTLVQMGATAQDRVMVNNPPGYYLISHREAIALPFGNENMVLAAALRYQSRYLVIEWSDSGSLLDLYYNQVNKPGFHFLASLGTTRIYEIIP